MSLSPTEKTVPGCSECGEPAVIYQQANRRYLCARHLVHEVEERVASTIRSEDLILPGDRIAVALSGGKDSTALLVILSRIFRTLPGATLVAVTVDEGITGYRTDTIRAAETLTKNLGIEHHTISFRDLIGDDLDTLLSDREKQACTICGILRKKAVSLIAEKVNATVIATGHNLDDEAQSVLMNALRGDLPRIIRKTETRSPTAFLPRIKPLASISEKEISVYLFVQGLFPHLPECPYACHSLRSEVRSLLSGLEIKHPGTMQNLIESKKSIEQSCSGMPVQGLLVHCKKCGDPCSGDICQFCRIRASLGK